MFNPDEPEVDETEHEGMFIGLDNELDNETAFLDMAREMDTDLSDFDGLGRDSEAPGGRVSFRGDIDEDDTFVY
jgi:hypothetical protein